MAQEFTEADLSPFFRSNGTSMPEGDEYQALARNGFADWQLEVDGLVEKPVKLSLAELRAMPRRTQITRHDCVEGWSAIGKWTGVPLSNVLAMVKPQPSARYVVFHCADPMGGSLTPEYYYESIDMDDALHPQTILAYGLNGKDLPIPNGAPIRLRVERQLGYKHAKYRDAHRACRQLCEHRRRQGRLLGRQRLPVVRRHLTGRRRTATFSFVLEYGTRFGHLSSARMNSARTKGRQWLAGI